MGAKQTLVQEKSKNETQALSSAQEWRLAELILLRFTKCVVCNNPQHKAQTVYILFSNCGEITMASSAAENGGWKTIAVNSLLVLWGVEVLNSVKISCSIANSQHLTA